jgi:hypothetical protein
MEMDVHGKTQDKETQAQVVQEGVKATGKGGGDSLYSPCIPDLRKLSRTGNNLLAFGAILGSNALFWFLSPQAVGYAGFMLLLTAVTSILTYSAYNISLCVRESVAARNSSGDAEETQENSVQLSDLCHPISRVLAIVARILIVLEAYGAAIVYFSVLLNWSLQTLDIFFLSLGLVWWGGRPLVTFLLGLSFFVLAILNKPIKALSYLSFCAITLFTVLIVTFVILSFFYSSPFLPSDRITLPTKLSSERYALSPFKEDFYAGFGLLLAFSGFHRIVPTIQEYTRGSRPSGAIRGICKVAIGVAAICGILAIGGLCLVGGFTNGDILSEWLHGFTNGAMTKNKGFLAFLYFAMLLMDIILPCAYLWQIKTVKEEVVSGVKGLHKMWLKRRRAGGEQVQVDGERGSSLKGERILVPVTLVLMASISVLSWHPINYRASLALIGTTISNIIAVIIPSVLGLVYTMKNRNTKRWSCWAHMGACIFILLLGILIFYGGICEFAFYLLCPKIPTGTDTVSLSDASPINLTIIPDNTTTLPVTFTKQ